MKKSILYSTMLLSVIALAACSSPSTTNGTEKIARHQHLKQLQQLIKQIA